MKEDLSSVKNFKRTPIYTKWSNFLSKGRSSPLTELLHAGYSKQLWQLYLEYPQCSFLGPKKTKRTNTLDLISYSYPTFISNNWDIFLKENTTSILDFIISVLSIKNDGRLAFPKPANIWQRGSPFSFDQVVNLVKEVFNKSTMESFYVLSGDDYNTFASFSSFHHWEIKYLSNYLEVGLNFLKQIYPSQENWKIPLSKFSHSTPFSTWKSCVNNFFRKLITDLEERRVTALQSNTRTPRKNLVAPKKKVNTRSSTKNNSTFSSANNITPAPISASPSNPLPPKQIYQMKEEKLAQKRLRVNNTFSQALQTICNEYINFLTDSNLWFFSGISSKLETRIQQMQTEFREFKIFFTVQLIHHPQLLLQIYEKLYKYWISQTPGIEYFESSLISLFQRLKFDKKLSINLDLFNQVKKQIYSDITGILFTDPFAKRENIFSLLPYLSSEQKQEVWNQFSEKHIQYMISTKDSFLVRLIQNFMKSNNQQEITIARNVSFKKF